MPKYKEMYSSPLKGGGVLGHDKKPMMAKGAVYEPKANVKAKGKLGYKGYDKKALNYNY